MIQWLISIWLENRSHDWLQTCLGMCRTLDEVSTVLRAVTEHGDANDSSFARLYIEWAIGRDILPKE